MGAKIWEKCLYTLEDELSSQQFNTWIRPLQAVGDDCNVKLLAPNRYIKDQVNTQFLNRIQELLTENGAGPAELGIGSKLCQCVVT